MPHFFSLGENRSIVFEFEMASALLILSLELRTQICDHLKDIGVWYLYVLDAFKKKKLKNLPCSNIQQKTYTYFLMSVGKVECDVFLQVNIFSKFIYFTNKSIIRNILLKNPLLKFCVLLTTNSHILTVKQNLQSTIRRIYDYLCYFAPCCCT